MGCISSQLVQVHSIHIRTSVKGGFKESIPLSFSAHGLIYCVVKEVVADCSASLTRFY